MLADGQACVWVVLQWSFPRRNNTKVRSSIEKQENNNRKEDIIETIQKNPSTIIQKKELDIGKDLEKVRDFVRQTANNPKETLRKEFSIEKDIEKDKERNMIRKEKEKENDDLIKVVNKERRDNSKKNNSFKEEINERLKSIEKTMDYTRDNSLVELAKKIEILNSPIEIKEMKKDITVLEITELSDNEKLDRHIRNTICHKCKQYGHTKKKCDRHNKIVKQISKLEFEKYIINELMEMFDVTQKEIDQVKKKRRTKFNQPT